MAPVDAVVASSHADGIPWVGDDDGAGAHVSLPGVVTAPPRAGVSISLGDVSPRVPMMMPALASMAGMAGGFARCMGVFRAAR